MSSKMQTACLSVLKLLELVRHKQHKSHHDNVKRLTCTRIYDRSLTSILCIVVTRSSAGYNVYQYPALLEGSAFCVKYKRV